MLVDLIDEIPPENILSRAAQILNQSRKVRKGQPAKPVCCLRCRIEFRTQKEFRFHNCRPVLAPGAAVDVKAGAV